MEDITTDLVMTAHTRIIADTGGDCRVLSEANLHEIVFRANLIPACIPRAAFVFYSLCAYPAFREGNTATARAVTEWILASGGFRIPADADGIMALADGILAFSTEPEEIEQWLSTHVQTSPP